MDVELGIKVDSSGAEAGSRRVGTALREMGGSAEQAQRSLDRIGKADFSVTIAQMRTAALAAAAAAAAFTVMVKGALAAADTLGDTAAQLGLTAEALQELQFAFRQTGVSSEEFVQAMTIFSDNLAQATAKTGPLADVIKRWGLDAKALARDPARLVPGLA